MGTRGYRTGTGSGARVWKRTAALSRTDDNPGHCHPDRVAAGLPLHYAVRLSLLYLACNITNLGIANIALRSRRFR
jgi:hypothetical protein